MNRPDEHDHEWQHVAGLLFACECGVEQEMTEADFGGPDTAAEARGEK